MGPLSFELSLIKIIFKLYMWYLLPFAIVFNFHNFFSYDFEIFLQYCSDFADLEVLEELKNLADSYYEEIQNIEDQNDDAEDTLETENDDANFEDDMEEDHEIVGNEIESVNLGKTIKDHTA